MISLIYLVIFLTAVFVMLTLVLKHKRSMNQAVLFSILITINSFGRYLISVAESYELARLGNILVYTGGCYIPLLVVKILAMLCQVKFPRWATGILAAASTTVYGLVMTIGHSQIYYKICYLVRKPGFHYLEKIYGPAHFLFPLLIAVYSFVMLGLLILGIRRRKEISFRMVSSIVSLAAVIIFGYALERILDSHVNYLSLGYLIALLIFTRMTERINMYDLPANIANSIEALNENAYVEFDSEYRVMGYNSRFKELFPQVEKQWPIDRKVQMDDSFLYQEIILWMYCRKPGQVKMLPVGCQFYEMYVRPIPYGRKSCVGYMLELVDRTDSERYTHTIEHYNENLQRQVEKKTEHISKIKDMMVVGMASMVESRDNSTGDHIKRTYGVMQIFCRHLLQYRQELGISQELLEMATRAAPMHDLGKIAVDDAVLRKKGKFTPEEYEKMKKHPEEGAKIVREILTDVEDKKFVKVAVNVAHYHHEKWNGQGYPAGLSGESIPVEARLMALADVFDALVSKRCYKEAYSYDRAFGIIEESLGSHFDPVLGRYFMECRPQLEEMYRKWDEEDKSERTLCLETTLA